VPDPADEQESEMSEQTIERVAERRHVKLWFGQHVIGEFVGEAEHAERYAEAMDKRFGGLKITTEPIPPGVTPVRALPLPSKRLWDNTPH
jgi:hypothetical protein